MGLLFEYNNPDTSAAPGKQIGYRSLHLRHSPYEVNWTYNVNTAQYDTYGGQVVQVLSINIDTLTIQGQLGKEGPFGVYRVGAPQADDRYGGPVPRQGFSHKYVDRQFDYNSVTYPGLHAIVEFFREYFAVVSQGGDPQNPGRFVQVPVVVSYDGGPSHNDRKWVVTPTQFPDFRRANDNFAPEYRIQCEVIEADSTIKAHQKNAAIQRLQAAIGYKARNPFSDPLADPGGGSASIMSINNQIASRFKAVLPQFSKGELEDMVWQKISVPQFESAPGTSPIAAGDIMQGEVGVKTSKQVADQSAGGHGAIQ